MIQDSLSPFEAVYNYFLNAKTGDSLSYSGGGLCRTHVDINGYYARYKAFCNSLHFRQNDNCCAASNVKMTRDCCCVLCV